MAEVCMLKILNLWDDLDSEAATRTCLKCGLPKCILDSTLVYRSQKSKSGQGKKHGNGIHDSTGSRVFVGIR